MSWKRPLIVAHRWLGIVLCAFFALWFASGIFMMYVDFPQLTRPERLAVSPALDFSAARLTPGAALGAVRAGDFDTVGAPNANHRLSIADPAGTVDAASVRLGMLLGRPVYYVYPEGDAQPRAVRADSGEVLARVDRAVAMAVAADFITRSGHAAPALRYLGEVQTDQWSVSSALNAHRPLHHIALDDDAGTELYVSSTTGEVVRDSHRLERALNYPAAVTHWLYPTVIRRYVDLWDFMVKLLSGVGAVLALTGLWIGVMRWRRRTSPGMSSIPYRGLMRWHHITGLAFGLVALTWVFSGMLSLNPGGLNPSRTPTEEQTLVYSGRPLTPEDFGLPAFSPAAGDMIEAELMHYAGSPYYMATARDGSVHLLAGEAPGLRRAVEGLPVGEEPGLRPAAERSMGKAPDLRPTAEAMIARAPLLMPDAPLLEANVLHEYDDYWYTRSPESGGKPLPVVRAEFDDAARTWFYLDPATGRVLERSTRLNRVYRWLYNGLHSWDFRWLWERRPLWDIAVIAFSLGGLALSVTGIIAGVRHLRRELRLARRGNAAIAQPRAPSPC